MFSVYFALISAYSNSTTQPDYASAMRNGEFDAALRHAERLDRAAGGVSRDACQAMADAALLLGRDEDAEENYRKAQKLLRGSNDQLRVSSCRNTGWQALALHRYSAALHCFSRIGQDDAAKDTDKIEAALAVAMIHHQLGQQGAAAQALAHARVLAVRHDHEACCMLLIDMLALDFSVQLGIRCSAGLRDHAFWQSVSTRQQDGALLATVSERLRLAAADVPPLMAQHGQYLALLVRLADGERGTGDALAAHAARARKWDCQAYNAGVRLEVALAALAGDFVEMAEQSLLGAGPCDGATRRWNLDYLYCQAKISLRRGHADEAIRHYSAYMHDALQCLRNETQVVKSFDAGSGEPVERPSDDVSARLPAKYRRAYRYIVANFNKNDLCTREIAAHIGVTERALQMAFKEHLGMSPTAVVRRLRLDAIRSDLLEEGQSVGNIIQTANRWGLKSRSALIRGYRKQFHESPSETSHR